MSIINASPLLGAGADGYQIERSLRFNSADSAYLTRTPASAGNRKTWTWSGWVKICKDSTSDRYIFAGNSATTDTGFFGFGFTTASTTLFISGWATNWRITTQVFRDFSAWYHIVVALDTTQATANDRVKVYVNGVQVTAFSTTNNPTQNADLGVNTAAVHYLSSYNASAAMFDGYLTEVHFIDGQALTPSSFGETDTITGVWKPKKYIHTTSSATSWDYRAYSGTGSPGSWSSMTSVSSGNALGANSSSGTSNPSVAIYSAGAKSKIFRFTGGSGDSRTINVWSSDDGVTWTSQASTTFSVLGGSGHQTTGQYAVYQFANGDFFSSSSYAVTVNDINSFYLKFADNSGTTSTTLGKDSSGNGNNWTPNNFSVTAGAGNDSMIDTPTPYADGGNGRGNYCTLNPLDKNSSQVPKDGNLYFDGSVATGGLDVIAGTMRVTSGKWYWESTITNVGSIAVASVGITKIQCVGRSNGGSLGNVTGECAYRPSGDKQVDGSSTAYGASFTTGDVIGVALDCDAGTVTFYKNNSSQGSISYAVGNGLAPAIGQVQGYGAIQIVNFGQRPFAYTPPSGFKALNTQNLPEPSIKKPSSYMDVLTWSGTGGGSGATRSLTGLGFSPDLVWQKARSSGTNHRLLDAVRGAGTGKTLSSNTTSAEGDGGSSESLYGYLSSFDSNGFTLTNGTSTFDNGNKSGDTYVAWCWDESATPGFDIVTYSGNGASPRSINHSLGVAPSFVVVKNRTTAGYEWPCYHTSLGTGKVIWLQLTNEADLITNRAYGGIDSVSSTTFTVKSGGTNGANVNANGDNYVAYLWSEVAGFSKFGSYTGNGSSDGPFVFCGFRPRWVMMKSSSINGSNWRIFDTARDPANVMIYKLSPNNSDAEYTDANTRIDFTSNGFKLRETAGDMNSSGATYVFAAFAEFPAKYSLAR